MSTTPRSAAEGRARARGAWPVRTFRLGEEPGDDLRRTTTAAGRIAMVASLTEEAWALAGRDASPRSRSSWPVRLVETRRP